MKTGNLLIYEDYISPLIHVIIKNETEIIANKIYPKNLPLKSILFSEGLPSNNNYMIQNQRIDINKPIIELISKNFDELTDIELVIESENILDTSESEANNLNHENIYYRILKPYEKPFRILSFNPQDNSVSIKKYDKETLTIFDLNNFSLSKSGYCNTFDYLFISNGENNNFYKIDNIKLTLEKLEDLPWPKKYHSMIYIPKKYIYFIGGDSRITFYYDFVNKIFKLWAPLKYQEKYPGLIYLNKTYIYAFGHQKQLGDLNFFERTDIKRKPKWDVINIRLNEPFNLKRFAAVLSNDEKIYFVGGKEAKNDKIFFFDLKTNEISKTTQINTVMRINEPNFYDINEFTSILLPQETNGDIKFIAFNKRTKKFRKLRYERDYDLISETNIIELNENDTSSENMKLTAEINFKIIENKFEKEKKEILEQSKEGEIKMPNLSEIKKLLLGDKNILNKNVEAMIFNRKRIKNKKNDKIDGDDSEDDYNYFNDFDEDENNLFKNEKEEIDIEEEDIAKLDKNNLRAIPKRKDDINININKGSYLRQLLEQDVEQEIDILKVKNPRITLDDYQNVISFNRLTTSYLQHKLTNSNNNSIGNIFGLRQSETSPFQSNNDNKYYFDLTGKKRNISINNIDIINNDKNNKQNKKSINKDLSDVKENISSIVNSNIDDKKEIIKEKIKEEINNQKNYLNANINTPHILKTSTPENNLENNKSNQKKGFNLKTSENEDYILNATIKGKITSIIGENNFGILKAHDTYKSLTLRELFDGDVDDKFILNAGTIVVPGGVSNKVEKDIKEDNKNNINIEPKTEIFTGIIEGTKKINKNKNIKPTIDNKEITVNKPELNIKTKIPDLDIDINKPNKFDNDKNEIVNLEELFNKDIEERIYLKVINPELWDIENNKYSGIINQKKVNNIDITFNNPNIILNIPNNPDNDKDIKIPVINSNNKKDTSPDKTIKELFGKDINDDIDLNVIHQILWPSDNFDLDGKKLGFKEEINLPNVTTKIPRTSDLENAEISIYTEIKPIETLKEEFGKDIDENIYLNICKNKLYSNEVDFNNADKEDIEINIPNINKSDIKLRGNIPKIDAPKVNINNNNNIEEQKINVNIKGNIPGKEINSNKSKKNTEFNPSFILKEIFNEDIESPINLNIKKHILKPNKECNISNTKNKNKKTDTDIKSTKINKSVNSINTEIKIPRYESIIGEIPGKNLNKSRFELITGEIPGTIEIGRKTEVLKKKSGLKEELQLNKPKIIADKPKINANIPNTNMELKGPKIKGKKHDIKKPKLNDEQNDIFEITLKQIFSKDINDTIKLKVIKPELWGIDDNISSGLINGKNININLPSDNIDIKTSENKLPKFTLTGSISDKNKDINKDINEKISGINLNNPEININNSKPDLDINFKTDNDSLIILKDLFGKDIDNDINLNIIKQDLWDNNVNNYNISGIISGNLNSNFGKASVTLKKPNINIPDINPNLNLETNINTQKIDANLGDKDSIPSLEINEPEINNTIKLKGPHLNAKLDKPDIDIKIKDQKIDLINNKEGNNNAITLKQLFNQDVSDKIELKIINPKLWGEDEIKTKGMIHRSVNLKFPKRNVDMNDPDIDNIRNYSLKASFNKPEIDTNIDIGDKLLNQSFDLPEKDHNINIPKIDANGKNPEFELKFGKIRFNKNRNEKIGKNDTLKEICNGNIEDNINLKVKNPKLWGIGGYNFSGLITGEEELEFQEGKINIRGPNINVPNFSLDTNNKPNVNLKGDIKEIDIKEPDIKTNLKGPKVNTNAKIPNFNIGGIKSGDDKMEQKMKDRTLKELFNKDINDDIYLNIVKQELWDIDNYNITTKINGNLNIDGPNINIPNYSLTGDININKPKIETNLIEDLSGSIPSLEANEPEVNIKVPDKEIKPEIKPPEININFPDIKFDINNNDKGNKTEEKLFLTLKQMFNEDINEDINLKVINPQLWGNDNFNISEIIEEDINMNFPKINIDISGPKLNVPDINLRKGNIKGNINKNCPDTNLNSKKPNIDFNINGNASETNKPDLQLNRDFKPSITLKEEFGKDINDNDFSLKIQKHILSPDLSNIMPNINNPDFNFELPKEDIKLNPEINIKNTPSNINVDLPKTNTNLKTKTIKPSRNIKRFVEETISGEIPGIKINKTRTEIFTGEIPGIKVKKSETIDIKNQKQDFDENISGKILGKKGKDKNKKIDLNLKEQKFGTNISGPNIIIDKDIPELNNLNDFDVVDILFDPSLKDLFSGDVNDEINLNIVKQKLWDNENEILPGSNNADILIKLPNNNISISKTNINIPDLDKQEVNINLNQNINTDNPELNDINLKIPDIDIDVNKPKFNSEIKGIIPGFKADNKIKDEINIDIDDDIIDLELSDKKENIELNKVKFIQDKTLKNIFSEDVDDNIKLNNLNSKLSPDFQNLELKKDKNVPNITLKGLKTNLRSNKKNEEDKIEEADIRDININNKETNLKINLHESNNKNELKKNITLKQLFDKDIDYDDYYELNVVNQVLLPRNNTLYISGNLKDLKVFPTDDISIKGPNIRQPFLFNKDIKSNKSEISNQNKSINNVTSESDIRHNIPNNFDYKIKISESEKNSLNKNDIITLKELCSKNVNDNIKLTILHKNIDNNYNLDDFNYNSSNCDENIQGDIIPINIDIKYSSPTKSNNIINISPSKKKESSNKFNRAITLKDLFNMGVNAPFNLTNTHIDYTKENKIVDEKEENNEEEFEFELPGENDIKSLNSITHRLNNINNKVKNDEEKDVHVKNDNNDFMDDDLIDLL